MATLGENMQESTSSYFSYFRLAIRERSTASSRSFLSAKKDSDERLEQSHGSHEQLVSEALELEQPTIPTTVYPLYKERLVLLKIGDRYLRIGTGIKPICSKLKPPLYPPTNMDKLERLLDPKGPGKPVPKNFPFRDFTFYADESATITESWYRNAKAFFNIRLGVKRNGEDGNTEYLCVRTSPGDAHEVQFDANPFCSWWRLTAVGSDQFVAECTRQPGRCLMDSRFGLCMSPPITKRDRARMYKGVWDKVKTLTIVTLPDFAVDQPTVYVS